MRGMTLFRSVAVASLLLAACGGGSKSSTMPAEPMPATTAPAADEAATPVEPTPAEPAMAPAAAAPVEEAVPAAAPPPPPAAPRTRGAVKKPAKAADPCDGGE